MTVAVDRPTPLWRLADPSGIVAGIALDHRDSFRVALAGAGVADPSDAELREMKLRLARALAPAATAVMLDHELGRRAIEDGAMPPGIGLIMPLEAQGYEAAGDDRVTTLMDDFGPADALRLGAAACKVLVPYRADRPAAAADQEATIREAVDACHRVGLPIVVEPAVHRLSSESVAHHAAAYPDLVVAAVGRVAALGVDLLKLPFPVHATQTGVDPAGDETVCRRMDGATAGVPWVLLGAGAPIEAFVAQLRIAGEAGAAGFLAGRGIWGPAIDRDPDVVAARAEKISRPALDRCRALAAAVCRPLPRAA